MRGANGRRGDGTRPIPVTRRLHRPPRLAASSGSWLGDVRFGGRPAVPGHEAGRYARDVGARRQIPRNHRAHADPRSSAHVDAVEHDRGRSHTGVSRDDCLRRLLVSSVLQVPGDVRGTRLLVVDKHHTVADEHLIGDLHSFPDEGVALDLAACADRRARWISTNGSMRLSAPMRRPYRFVKGAIWAPGPMSTLVSTRLGAAVNAGTARGLGTPTASRVPIEPSALAYEYGFVASREVAFRNRHAGMRPYVWLRDDLSLGHSHWRSSLLTSGVVFADWSRRKWPEAQSGQSATDVLTDVAPQDQRTSNVCVVSERRRGLYGAARRTRSPSGPIATKRRDAREMMREGRGSPGYGF